MPLKHIKSMLDEDPDRPRALVELEDRILERAIAGEQKRVSATGLRKRYDLPQEVLDRLAELDVLTPNSRGYSQSDVEIVEAISTSGPAATRSGSALPSTTPSATSARSRSSSRRRSTF